MITRTFRLCSSFLFSKVLSSCLYKNIAINCRKTMELTSEQLSQLTVAYQKIKDMKKKIESLKSDIISIQTDFSNVESLPVFQQFQKRGLALDNIDNPNSKRLKPNFPMVNDYVVVYTDGACENNGTPHAKAGIGVWFADNHPFNVSKPVEGNATNNTAEIQACISAVQIAKNNGINKLKIITDSQFVINSMTKWIKGWKKNGWKLSDGKSHVKNKNDFQKLDNLCNGLSLQWEHVAGHSGILGNEKADKLAREGAKLYK